MTILGFVAQFVNASLGMSFGVITTTGLLALSLSAPTASSIVHLTEVGTSLVTGRLHWRQKNVDPRVVLLVGIPGSLAAFCGALLLTRVDLSASRPYASLVLLILGATIIYRNVRSENQVVVPRRRPYLLIPLGLVGGFVDSTGGGGWGTIITSTLTASRTLDVRRSIGTSITARFMVATAGSIGFILSLGFSHIYWAAVGAILLGSLIAAPLGVRIMSRINTRNLGFLTGVLIVLLNMRQVVLSPAVPSWIAIALIVLCAFGITVAVIVRVAAVWRLRLGRSEK